MAAPAPRTVVPMTSAAESTAAARRDEAAWRIAALPERGDLAAAEAFCRAVARRHYENFTVATRLVPPRLRQHMANVYAFARWSDDLADESANPGVGTTALAAWRRELEKCFDGRPEHPVFVALADTVRRTGLTIEPFAHLIDAFDEDNRLDGQGVAVRYHDRRELVEYCRLSANPVGRIVLALEGCRDATCVAMSDSICTALQLVNFWQDLRRDRLAGRVYLPREDMLSHGVDEAMLDESHAVTSLRSLLQEEVGWARELFAAGEPLAAVGPPSLRPAISLFLAGGRAVADAIERAEYDTLSFRPTVGRWTKLTLAARAWWRMHTQADGQGP